VRIWLAACVVLSLMILATCWPVVTTPRVIAWLLFPYLILPWFVVVMLLGISPVTGARLDSLADGILSRPITRYEYLLGAWLARVLLVVGLFLEVLVPAVLLVVFAERPVADDAVTVYGVVGALGSVALVLTWLVSLGFLTGTLVRQPLLAAALLFFAWLVITLSLHSFSLEEFSPISLNQALPTLLRTPWTKAESGASSQARTEDVEALEQLGNQFTSILTGRAPPPRRPQQESFLDKGDYHDFALWRVLLGYGLPTVLAVWLSMLWFSRRDL
jgi:hypothetical protein